MTQQRNATDEKWTDKLIRFFRRMPGKKPDTSEVDYSGWHQSEEQYQKEQAQWLKQIKARGKRKRHGDDGIPK